MTVSLTLRGEPDAQGAAGAAPPADVRQSDAWKLLSLMAEDQAYISERTAAKLLDLSESTVRGAVRDGELEGFECGAEQKVRMVTVGSLVRFLNRIYECAYRRASGPDATAGANLAAAEA